MRSTSAGYPKRLFKRTVLVMSESFRKSFIFAPCSPTILDQSASLEIA